MSVQRQLETRIAELEEQLRNRTAQVYRLRSGINDAIPMIRAGHNVQAVSDLLRVKGVANA